MNDLIERYIYDVVRRLPEGERDEVRRELEANVADMLPDNPGEQDITAVLEKLGAPSQLAEQYRQSPRYLISPAMYDSYISVLKPVMLVVALAVGLGSVLAKLLQFPDIEDIGSLIGSIIGSVIGGAFEGALQAALWVTVGFVIADRTGSYKAKAWTVSGLPKLPDKNRVAISRSGIIVDMALTVFFTGLGILLITKYESLVIFVHNSEIIHPFTQEALFRFIPYALILGGLSLAVSGVKLYYGRWNILLCITNVMHNVIWVSVVIYVLHWPDLLHPDFVAFAERTFTAEQDILSHVSTGGTVLFISAILIIVAVVDSAVGVWNTYKQNTVTAGK